MTPLAMAVQALRRRSVWLLLSAIVCAVVAGYAAHKRKPAYLARVQLSVGAVKPIGWLEDPEDLMRRFQSPTQFYQIAGLDRLMDGTVTSTTMEGVTITRPDLDTLWVNGLFTKPRLVELRVQLHRPELAEALATRAATNVLADHMTYWDTVLETKGGQIERYRRVLLEIEASKPTKEEGVTWQSAIDLAYKIAILENDHLQPLARPTRLVFGPDVARVSPDVPVPLATGVGFFAGMLLAAFLVLTVEVVFKDLLTPKGDEATARMDDQRAGDVTG